ncbi:hypothetical protein M1555_03085 [Patescibacteria group bacterium]|nr:hypothetical protein [Patescibacteria group bacterium]
MENEPLLPPIPRKEVKTVIIVTVVASAVLMASAVLAYRSAASVPGQTVLPAGDTYLGPSGTPGPSPAPDSPYIPVAADATWKEFKGKIFPYRFRYPATLNLGVFPNDPFDSVTIFWGNTNPEANLILRVENLTHSQHTAQYVKGDKMAYIESWWKQYTYKGVSTVTKFTNSQGLTGYRAVYLGSDGEPVPDNVFFEVPGRPELLIWMSTRLLSPDIFNRIIDTVSWT